MSQIDMTSQFGCARYTSQIDLTKDKLVLTRVADSTLFSSLDNRWEFEQGPTANSCWLTFSIDFAFKSPLYGQLATVFFKEVCAAYHVMPLIFVGIVMVAHSAWCNICLLYIRCLYVPVLKKFIEC